MKSNLNQTNLLQITKIMDTVTLIESIESAKSSFKAPYKFLFAKNAVDFLLKPITR